MEKLTELYFYKKIKAYKESESELKKKYRKKLNEGHKESKKEYKKVLTELKKGYKKATTEIKKKYKEEKFKNIFKKNNFKKNIFSFINWGKLAFEKVLLSLIILLFIYILKDDGLADREKIIGGITTIILIIDFNLIISLNFIRKEEVWLKSRLILYAVIGFFIFLNFGEFKAVLLELFIDIKIVIAFFMDKSFPFIFKYYKISFISLMLIAFIYLYLSLHKDYQKWLFIKENRARLLSFRIEELEELQNLIKNKEIPSILLDNKIGNGKTKLLEIFIENDKNNLEIIYMKLPMILDLECLKNIFYKELKKIFYKNNIKNNYLKDYIFNISTVKSKFVEFCFNFRNNNWETIQELKSSLQELEEKGKKILIILDDIERVENIEFIRDSIFFLGEMSECFRDTETTIIYAAQYDDILNKLNNSKNKLDDSKEKEKCKLNKYFSYIFTMKKTKLGYLSKEDVYILFLEVSSEKEEIIKYGELIYALFSNINYSIILSEDAINSLKINENIRNIKKFINKVITKVGRDSDKSFGIIHSIFILNDIFLENSKISEKDRDVINKGLYNRVLETLKLNKEIQFNENKFKEIEKSYNENEKIGNEFLLTTEKVIRLLKKGESSEKFENLNQNELNFIFDFIGEDIKKINKFFELNIKFDLYDFLERIAKYIEKGLLSENSIKVINNYLEESIKNSEIRDREEWEIDLLQSRYENNEGPGDFEEFESYTENIKILKERELKKNKRNKESAERELRSQFNKLCKIKKNSPKIGENIKESLDNMLIDLREKYEKKEMEIEIRYANQKKSTQ